MGDRHRVRRIGQGPNALQGPLVPSRNVPVLAFMLLPRGDDELLRQDIGIGDVLPDLPTAGAGAPRAELGLSRAAINSAAWTGRAGM